MAIHFWQNFNCGSVADVLAVVSHPPAQGATPLKPPTDAFRCAARRPRGGADAGRGPVLISGEVLEAGIELSFGGNAKPAGTSFLLFARISGDVRSGSN